jgi:hypothetical protein
MKPYRNLRKWVYMVILLLNLASLAGCTSTPTYKADLVLLYREKRLTRQDFNDIAYQVRKYAEENVRSNIGENPEAYTDRLGYWKNAEWVNICGLVTLKLSPEPTPENNPTPQSIHFEIISADVEILYQGFMESANAMQLKYVSAQLVYENNHWVVKNAEGQTEQSLAKLTLDGNNVHWLNQ